MVLKGVGIDANMFSLCDELVLIPYLHTEDLNLRIEKPAKNVSYYANTIVSSDGNIQIIVLHQFIQFLLLESHLRRPLTTPRRDPRSGFNVQAQ